MLVTGLFDMLLGADLITKDEYDQAIEITYKRLAQKEKCM
jgi:hypothetical protein